MLKTLVNKLLESGLYTKQQAEKTARRIVIDSSFKRNGVEQYAIGGLFNEDFLGRKKKYILSHQEDGVEVPLEGNKKNVVDLRDAQYSDPNYYDDAVNYPEMNNGEGDLVAHDLNGSEDLGLQSNAFLFQQQGLNFPLPDQSSTGIGISDRFTPSQSYDEPFYPTFDGKAPSSTLLPLGNPSAMPLKGLDGVPKTNNGTLIPMSQSDVNNYNNASYKDKVMTSAAMDALTGKNPFKDGSQTQKTISENKNNGTFDFLNVLNPYGFDLEQSLYMAGNYAGMNPTTRTGKAGKALGLVGSIGKSVIGGGRAVLSGYSNSVAKDRYMEWMRNRKQRENYEASRQTRNASADKSGGVTNT
jgi:hypothetical protein